MDVTNRVFNGIMFLARLIPLVHLGTSQPFQEKRRGYCQLDRVMSSPCSLDPHGILTPTREAGNRRENFNGNRGQRPEGKPQRASRSMKRGSLRKGSHFM